MQQGTAAEQEMIESALLADWDAVAAAVRATYDDIAAPPALRRRSGEMLRMNSSNEALAIREGRCREIRLAFAYGDFLSQERAQDRFLEAWPDYEQAAHDLSRERSLPNCVRLRCVEMIQVTSDRPAAVALANFSRATRCYRAWGRANDPRAAKDEEAAWVHDDPNTYQSPDASFPLGTPASEATDRARDLFGLASDQYYDIAEVTSGNEKISAEERGQRAIRLRLAAIKYGKDDSIYEDYIKERKKDIEENKKKNVPATAPDSESH